jgi:hypothetical protein
MSVDLDQVKLRLEERAKAATGEDEVFVAVRHAPRSDEPAMMCEIEWATRDGLCRTTAGWSGPPPMLENQAMLLFLCFL